MNIITCEQVSSGHPDKICDQIADAVVTDCLRHDLQTRWLLTACAMTRHPVWQSRS